MEISGAESFQKFFLAFAAQSLVFSKKAPRRIFDKGQQFLVVIQNDPNLLFAVSPPLLNN